MFSISILIIIFCTYILGFQFYLDWHSQLFKIMSSFYKKCLCIGWENICESDGMLNTLCLFLSSCPVKEWLGRVGVNQTKTIINCFASPKMDQEILKLMCIGTRFWAVGFWVYSYWWYIFFFFLFFFFFPCPYFSTGRMIAKVSKLAI